MSFTETEMSGYESFVPRSKPTTRLLSMLDKDSSRNQTLDNSSYTTEYTYQELSPRDYYNSSFPSLISHLGPKARHRTNRKKKAVSMPTRINEESFESHFENDHKKKKQREEMPFTERMKRYNESRWSRIESVAKDKLDRYDKYVSDMNAKVRQQRILIEKKAEQQLQTLCRMEERRREDMLFQSPYGRMWRHHRTMQRRAYKLEPLQSSNVKFQIPNSLSSQATS
ncbi:hypothetical protein ACF0H5_018137 [Mactra antiquata]